MYVILTEISDDENQTGDRAGYSRIEQSWQIGEAHESLEAMTIVEDKRIVALAGGYEHSETVNRIQFSFIDLENGARSEMMLEGQNSQIGSVLQMEHSQETRKMLVATDTNTLIQIELLGEGVEAAINQSLNFKFWSLSAETKIIHFSWPPSSSEFHQLLTRQEMDDGSTMLRIDKLGLSDDSILNLAQLRESVPELDTSKGSTKFMGATVAQGSTYMFVTVAISLDGRPVIMVTGTFDQSTPKVDSDEGEDTP